MEKEKALLQMLADTADMYGHTLTTGAIRLWVAALRGYEVEQVGKAFERHMLDPDGGRFMPKPAHLMKFLEGSATDAAVIAWGKALEAASNIGSYTDVVFDDSIIHATIEDLGGWPHFCRQETAELSYLQHRFTQSYQAYAARQNFEYGRRLNGDRSPDSEYEKKGLPLPRPVFVGDVAKAQAVYRLATGKKTQITRDVTQALAAIAAKK